MLNFVNEAFRLISIDSLATHSNEQLASIYQNIMTSSGFKASLQQVSHSLEVANERQFNVVGCIGDPLVDMRTKKGLLLTFPMDTSNPGFSERWKSLNINPYKAEVKDDNIYGLGSLNKLAFLCAIKAAERIRSKKLNAPIYIAATAGYQFGYLGAKFLTKSMMINPKQVIVYEPTELKVVEQHKSSTLYQLSIHYNQLERDAKGFNNRILLKCYGKTASGAYPLDGMNAIELALNVIKKVKDANFQIKFAGVFGGSPYQKVADEATVEFYIQNSVLEEFKKYFKETLISDLGERSSDVVVEFGGVGETGVRFFPDNLIDAVTTVKDFLLDQSREENKNQRQEYDVPTNSVNLSKIEQGNGFVSLNADFRYLPSVDIEQAEKNLRDGIVKLNAQYPSHMFKLTRMSHTPAYSAASHGALYNQSKEVQSGLGIDAKSYFYCDCSEAPNFVAAGYETIVVGPGKARGNYATPGEHISVEQLDKAVHFYERVMERFCT